MAEALGLAGVALGGVTLGFQLFSGCIRGFMLFQQASNIGKDASAIRLMLSWAELPSINLVETIGPL